MVFSRLSSGSSSITIRPASAMRISKPISRAIGGGGRMPSRIAHIVSSPDIPEAAFATGPGACHSTTRCLPRIERKQIDGLGRGHGGSFE